MKTRGKPRLDRINVKTAIAASIVTIGAGAFAITQGVFGTVREIGSVAKAPVAAKDPAPVTAKTPDLSKSPDGSKKPASVEAKAKPAIVQENKGRKQANVAGNNNSVSIR